MQRAERGQINVKVIGLARSLAPTSVRPAAEAEQIRVSLENEFLTKGVDSIHLEQIYPTFRNGIRTFSNSSGRGADADAS